MCITREIFHLQTNPRKFPLLINTINNNINQNHLSDHYQSIYTALIFCRRQSMQSNRGKPGRGRGGRGGRGEGGRGEGGRREGGRREGGRRVKKSVKATGIRPK